VDVFELLDGGTADVHEAAGLTGGSHWQIYGAIRRGELQAIRIGRRLLIPRSSLRDYLETRLTKPLAGRL
jgi:excisionase family DNA binding protein